MGLLDVFNKKEDSKMESLINMIINDYGKGEPYNDLIKYIKSEEYIYDFSLIDEEDMIKIFKIMANMLSSNPNIIKDFKTLYEAILTSSKREDIDILIKSINKCNNENFIIIISKIAKLFSDKLSAINVASTLVDGDYSVTVIGNLIGYMVSARTYYVDDIVFQTRIIEVIQRLKKEYVNEDELVEFFSKEIKKDCTQAGLYPNIDEDKLFDLNKKIDDSIKSIDDIDSKISKINVEMINISTNIESRIKDLIMDKTKTFEQKYKSISKIMEEARANSISVTNTAKEEIERLGEHYLGLLDSKAAAKGVKKSRSEVKVTVNSSEKKEFTTNVILDKKKYNDIMNQLKGSNMYFHKSFDKILKYVVVKEPVMLVGPTGSGKTYIFKQIADILNLKLYDLGFVSDEYTTIRGYNDANGNFVKTPFYDVLKNGGICLFDEIDNSESKALIELHKVIDGSGYRPYIFPNGEEVIPHPNFTVVATSNTWGDGGDRNYTAREKLDKASLGRFTRIRFDYDDVLGEKILSKYPDILEVIKYYNLALKERGSDEILTTKDLGRIKYLLETEIVSWKDIIDDKLIRNMQADTLNAMINSMDKNISSNTRYNEFKTKVKTL